MKKIIIFFSIVISILSCHYSCSTSCVSQDYYNCLVCDEKRGNEGKPIFGMCYCSGQSDQNKDGVCEDNKSVNYTSKVLIVLFISLTLALSLFAAIVKGTKYFLYKTIEDVQELSLVVFINLYFPQQFDVFMTYLYKFNISSSTFANLAQGTLFQTLPDQSVVSKDGQNIYGKYRLLVKTSNFFSNQFTWLIVFTSILIFALIIRFLRNWLKKKQQFEILETIQNQDKNRSYEAYNYDQNLSQSMHSVHEFVKVEKKMKDTPTSICYWIVNKVYNFLWYHFLIVFFYFSIIELNINIFTQISNLTFNSDFATTGAFFSAFFLGLEIVVLLLLFLKAKEEMIKPEWMRDHSFTPIIYLIRTNYKTLTKYFWFISVFKKILLAFMITVLYDNPMKSIVGIASVHTIYLCLAIYCEPYQRRYLRIHFYLTQGLKTFLFLSLINFSSKYTYFAQLVDLTIILYMVYAFIFISHFFFLVVNILCEKNVYGYHYKRKFCKEEYQNLDNVYKVGYKANDKTYIYLKE